MSEGTADEAHGPAGDESAVTELTISVHQLEPALVVRLSGALDGPLTDDAALSAAVAAPASPASVVFDLREVELLSAAGRRGLLAVVEALRERGVRCEVVVDPATAAAATLRIAALPEGVEVYDAVERAPAGVQNALLLASARSADDTLGGQFAALTQMLLSVKTVGAALERIVSAGQTMIAGADMVSVTLRGTDGRFFTPVGTDAVAESLDQAQYRSGHGPCVDAALPDGPGFAASDDLASEPRWTHFAEEATRHGFASVLSTDLHPQRPTAVGGALNVYSKRVSGLDGRDRHTALMLAAHASLALAYTTAVELADLHTEQMRRAIDSRDVIGQAKGILMARRGMTADEAFDVLRRTSQDLNVKLVDLARTLAEQPDGIGKPGKPA
ncbi:ANTAR domain-containing protein [Lentzea sp. CA-135723]|uniref:ANTAR domain-containing protein n=1 Tax=Lentzea sp. CA-135723 TaxID=3239950 RepID=UPI003D9384F4